jgi:hypothetical protein
MIPKERLLLLVRSVVHGRRVRRRVVPSPNHSSASHTPILPWHRLWMMRGRSTRTRADTCGCSRSSRERIPRIEQRRLFTSHPPHFFQMRKNLLCIFIFSFILPLPREWMRLMMMMSHMGVRRHDRRRHRCSRPTGVRRANSRDIRRCRYLERHDQSRSRSPCLHRRIRVTGCSGSTATRRNHPS